MSIDTFGYRTVNLYPEINCFNSISTGKLTQGVGLGSFPHKLLYKSQIELGKGFATNNGYVEQSDIICKC